MIGIILCGHSEFSKGIRSAVELNAGKQDAFINLDFTPEMTPDTFGNQIETAIHSLENKIGTLIFTDLVGGTPYKASVQQAVKFDNVRVITGTNVSMLLETALRRPTVYDLNRFVKGIVETGSNQVLAFDINDLNFY